MSHQATAVMRRADCQITSYAPSAHVTAGRMAGPVFPIVTGSDTQSPQCVFTENDFVLCAAAGRVCNVH